MSKLSFRARQVDVNRKMPVFLAEEVSDLSEHALVNRAVAKMPTGMEKEEEMELHLQKAISAQQRMSTGHATEAEAVVIPIPGVSAVDADRFDRLYPDDYKAPKQYIKTQIALDLEPKPPDYDLDSEDENWLMTNQQWTISELQFESIMETLENQSEYRVVKPEEVKSLLKKNRVQVDDDVLLAVYDYWLTKRFKAASKGEQLIPRVKLEKRENSTVDANNPYVAFRRRAEKMQTRKNRKNDEESYEKALRVRMYMQRAVNLVGMMERREIIKRDLAKVSMDIAVKKYQNNDFSLDNLLSVKEGRLLSQCSQAAVQKVTHDVVPAPPTTKPLIHALKRKEPEKTSSSIIQQLLRKKAENVSGISTAEECLQKWSKLTESLQLALGGGTSSRTEVDVEETVAADRYAFKRRGGCRYYKASEGETNGDPWSWEQPHSRFQYYPAYLHSGYSSNTSAPGLRYVGLLRPRVGRGGRLLFDRLSPLVQQSTDGLCSTLDTTAQLHMPQNMTEQRPCSPSSIVVERDAFIA